MSRFSKFHDLQAEKFRLKKQETQVADEREMGRIFDEAFSKATIEQSKLKWRDFGWNVNDKN
ncbi:hypothetical protein Hdeb2414_s0666g00932731 [Helianthus debilis subsp. tardiflorus]